MGEYNSSSSKYTSGKARSLASLAGSAKANNSVTAKVGTEKDNSAAKASASASAQASDFIRQHAEMMKKKKEEEKKKREAEAAKKAAESK